MALIVGTLSSGLATVFAGADSFQTAADGWASAYATYAQGAQANGVIPVFTGLERQLLATTLAAAFAAGVADQGASLLTYLELAFQAFWGLPPVAFGAGAVTLAPPGLGALIGATFPLNLVATSTSQAAATVATVLDVWTHLVTVTFPGPVLATLL